MLDSKREFLERKLLQIPDYNFFKLSYPDRQCKSARSKTTLAKAAMLRDENDAWSLERCLETRAMPRNRAMRGAESNAWELKAIVADESDN